MFSPEEKALLLRSLLARRNEIMSDRQLAIEVVETLIQVRASSESIAPHQSYVDLYSHELSQVFELVNKVSREL